MSQQIIVSGLVALLVLACKPDDLPVEGGSATGAAEATVTSVSTGPNSLGDSSTTASSADESSSATTMTPGDDGRACVNNHPEVDCDDSWAQRNAQACNWWVDDCGPGAVCNFVEPYITACEPLPAAPRALNEPCDGGDCAKGLACWGVRGATHCRPRCSCDPTRPHCPDPNDTCVINDPEAQEFGVVCVPLCDPVDPMCPISGVSCLAGLQPLCFPVSSPPNGAVGEPCGDGFDCAPGLWCTQGAPGCGDGLCCSPFCRLDDPTACADLGDAVSCRDLSAGYGQVDEECYEGVGACRV